MNDFAGQDISRKMDGETFPLCGCGTHSFEPAWFKVGSAPQWKLTVQASVSDLDNSKFEACLTRKLRFTSSTVRFWRTSRTKTSLSHLNCQILRDTSHESFLLKSSTVRFWGTLRTKASFSNLQLSDFEGCLARKLRFHIFNCQVLMWKSRTKCVFES